MKKLVLVLVLLGAAAGGYWFYGRDRAGGGATKLRTTKLTRGEVIEGVQASGTVQPYLLVQVGTQVSGAIEKLFKDFNDPVKAGETIAILDSRRLVAQVAQDNANLVRSRADVERVKAQLRQAERDLERQRNLLTKEVTTQADVDLALANTDSLKAQVAVAEATVLQSQAQLDGDLVNLRYATIVSPVDGVIVSRSVDVGQTVAASLSAPTLFVIANDLTKIQVQASVPEAEIGHVQESQVARFGVDAHPDLVFEGRVSQVRLASTTVQNVVTYTVLVDAANPKSKLLPGMTASVTFEVARSEKDALRIPASALRFKAPDELLAPSPEKADKPENAEKGDRPRGDRGGREGREGKDPARAGRKPHGTVYVQDAQGLLVAVPVRLGISDGVLTEIKPLENAKVKLEEGTEVVTAIERDAEPTTKNPFAPQFPGGRGGGRGRH